MYDGIERRNNMENDNILALLESIKELLNSKIDSLSSKIDELKDDHKDEIQALRDEIKGLREKQNCLDGDIQALKNEPANKTASTIKTLKEEVLKYLVIGAIGLLWMWANRGFPLP